MTETEMYVALQSAIDRNKGAATWTDLRLAVMRATEAKLREDFNSMLSSYSIADLMQALLIIDREYIKQPPPLPASASFTSAFALAKPTQPAAKTPPSKKK